MTDRWIRWSQWGDGGMLAFGQMPVKEVDRWLREFGDRAKEIMDSTGADHVVYGMKLYDDDGSLEEVKFYLYEMGDEEFYKDVSTLKGCTIYALHNKKGDMK